MSIAGSLPLNGAHSGNLTNSSTRKEDNSIPSPARGGQTITPMNHMNQGEIPMACVSTGRGRCGKLSTSGKNQKTDLFNKLKNRK